MSRLLAAMMATAIVSSAVPVQAGGCTAPMPLDRALEERVLMIAEAGGVSDDHYRSFRVIEVFNAGLDTRVEVYDPRAAGRTSHEIPHPSWTAGETYELALIPRKNGAFNVHPCEVRADAPASWIKALRP